MDLDTAALLEHTGAFLERQPWFERAVAGYTPAPLELRRLHVLREGLPGCARVVLDRGDLRLHLILGWRDADQFAEMLAGREAALLGPVAVDGVEVLVYDALADDELALELLGFATAGAEQATRVRRVASLTSHASLVYDERLFVKAYRVLERGPRPEVEVMRRLDEAGFNAMLAPVAVWADDGADLALVREFQAGALEGRMLALTSLRDLLAHAADGDDEGDSSVAGGDLAGEMQRLGTTTGRMHVALVEAFGGLAGDPARFARAIAAGVDGEVTPTAPFDRGVPRRALADIADEVAALDASALGRQIRVHGDFHLRRVMRSEAGWLVAGFGDDPLYRRPSRRFVRNGAPGTPPVDRSPYGSPVEDLADMCFAIEQVAAEALALRPAAEADAAADLARSWTDRNCDAFVAGYLGVADAAALVPGNPAVLALVLEGFVVDRYSR